MEETEKKALLEKLADLPIMQYAFLDVSEIQFRERVRYICETECPQYGKSWACPPAVGTVEECRERCQGYQGAFLFTTPAQVQDIRDLKETLAAREGHEAVTRQVRDVFQEAGWKVRVLSTESCAICGACSYPQEPCRHPDKMFPCVESYGILVTELAEQNAIEFQMGDNIITWFSLVFFRR